MDGATQTPAAGGERDAGATTPATATTVAPAVTVAPPAVPTSATAVVPPTTTAPPPAVDPLAERRAEVLALISYPWQQRLPGWTIEFLPGRTGYLGYTWIAERRIEIYARSSQSAADLAFTLAHELGHAVDLTLFGLAERTSWLEARGRLDVPWWPGGAYSDFSSGCGDWAEAFAVWQLGGRTMSEVAGQPSGADLALVARLTRG